MIIFGWVMIITTLVLHVAALSNGSSLKAGEVLHQKLNAANDKLTQDKQVKFLGVMTGMYIIGVCALKPYFVTSPHVIPLMLSLIRYKAIKKSVKEGNHSFDKTFKEVDESMNIVVVIHVLLLFLDVIQSFI